MGGLRGYEENNVQDEEGVVIYVQGRSENGEDRFNEDQLRVLIDRGKTRHGSKEEDQCASHTTWG